MSLKIDLKIFALIILFYFTNQIEIYLIIMIFAIIHELGHLLVGILLGERPKEIKINPCGLSIFFKINPYEYNNKIKNASLLEIKKILIALAGPLTNLIIISISLFLNISDTARTLIVSSNIVITVFNLLPIYPLDGGRILKGVIHIFLGKIKSEKIINNESIIFTIILTAIASIGVYYFQNIAIFLIIIYLWILVIKENKNFKLKERIYEIMERKI